MVKQPTPQSFVGPQGSRSPGKASASDFGVDTSGLARGLQGLGGATAARQQEQENFQIAKALIEEQQFQNEASREAFNNATVDTTDFVDQRLASVDARNTETNERFNGLSQRGKEKLNLGLSRIRKQAQGQAITVQSRLSGAKAKGDFEDATVSLQQQAAANPERAAELRAQARQLANFAPGVGPLVKDQLGDIGEERVNLAAANALPPEEVIGRLTKPASKGKGSLSFAHPDQQGLDPSFRGSLESAAGDLGIKLKIQSGHRTLQYNRSIGSSDGSYHIKRKAADIDMTGMDDATRAQLVLALKRRGVTRFGTYGGRLKNMLHVDLGPDQGAFPAGGHFMHNKSQSNISRAPRWFKEVAGGKSTVRVADASGKIVGGKVGHDVLDRLTPRQQQTLLNSKLAEQERARRERRGSLELQERNDFANFALGRSEQANLTRDMFLDAYDPAVAEIKWQAYENERDVGTAINEFKTMDVQQMQDRMAAVQDRVDQPNNPTLAEDVKALSTMQVAATRIVEQREKKPLQYANAHSPEVKAAVETFQAEPTPENGTAYFDRLDAFYDTIQLPGRKRQFVQDNQIADINAAQEANDNTLPDKLRAVIAMTGDVEKQGMLFEEMVSKNKTLAVYDGAIDAWLRGDVGDSDRLFRAAAAFAPGTQQLKLLPEGSRGDISIELATLLNEGIGDAMYGVSMNVGRGEKQNRDLDLLRRTAFSEFQSNGGDAGGAVETATSLLYGDVKVVRSGNANMVVPIDTDERVIGFGVDALRPVIVDLAESQLRKIEQGSDIDNRGSLPAVTLADMIENGQMIVVRPNEYAFYMVGPEGVGQHLDEENGDIRIFTLQEIIDAGTTAQEALSQPVDDLQPQQRFEQFLSPEAMERRRRGGQ